MLTLKTALLGALAVVTIWFVVSWARWLQARRGTGTPDAPARPTAWETGVGFITNFFDTLGIGSYAPTTAIFKLRGMVPDERIPGTLTVGHALPAIVQAFIYISIVEVDPVTLVLLIALAILGARLGAGFVARWPRRKVQFGMGFALLAAAALFVLKNLDEMQGSPIFPGGEALGLDGGLLLIAVAGNFLLGALMTIGVGLYAPCLIMISLLGMDPRAAFPIMMGSCAFLMPVAGTKFARAGSYQASSALGLTLGGIPAVLLAAFIVKSLPLTALRWLVVVVVLYSSLMMIRSGVREGRTRAA
ncbi:MAG: permease [Gemmatimonadota bacterium]